MAKRTRLDTAVLTQALLRREVPGDRLMLTDEVMREALAGKAALSAVQRQALQSSPQTLRRFRALSLERSAEARRRAQASDRQTEQQRSWSGSSGLLLAADSGSMSDSIQTADGHWSLYFLEEEGGPLRVVLKLDPGAPFAPELLSEESGSARSLDVFDGDGSLLISGPLDADGELQVLWNFDVLPWVQIAKAGGVFRVTPSP